MFLWEAVNGLSLTSFNFAYERMNIRFDVTLGESFYRDKVDRIYQNYLNLVLRRKPMVHWWCFMQSILALKISLIIRKVMVRVIMQPLICNRIVSSRILQS